MFKINAIRKRAKRVLSFFFKRYPVAGYIAKWLFISFYIGVLIGTASAGFLHSLNWVTHYREQHQWLIAFLPIGGLGIGLLYYYYGKELEWGNNLLIEAIHRPKAIIPFRMAPLVYIGTLVTHLLGGSAGREGTALQMAGAIADQFSKPFQLTTNERKIIIMAAVAAGFGSVFGTPLAGAVFGLEFFLIGKLNYKALLPAVASSVIAHLVTTSWHTEHTHYSISVIPSLFGMNIIYAVVAGIVFGLCAAMFSRGMHFLGTIFKTYISFPPLRPFIGGGMVALAIWAIGTTKYIGLGIPTIQASFNEQLPVYDFALKMLFTLVTLAAGFKGGEVTPLFFIGAALGNALSYFIPLPISLLAGMGFVAVFSGATNTPLACCIMAIELFGSEIGMYAAIATVLAYLVSGYTSIYNKQVLGVSKYNEDSWRVGKSIGESSENNGLQ